MTTAADKKLEEKIDALSLMMKGYNQQTETVVANREKAIDEISAIKPDQDALDRIRRSVQSVRVIVVDTEVRLQKYQAKA
jgi:DNA repair ATPase RecN